MAPNRFSLSTRMSLPNGLSIPQIHLGVYLMSGKEASDAVRHALTAGYRAVDSAQMYRNERECGQAILSWLKDKELNKSSLTRDDIFFTSKLASNSSYASARNSIQKSVDACGLGYIDLFLLHSPYGGKAARLASWKAVEDAIDAGLIKTGGVSNFGVKHLEELLASQPKTLPAINQIEVHPVSLIYMPRNHRDGTYDTTRLNHRPRLYSCLGFNTRTNITSFCKQNGIIIEAYAPLARALRMRHPAILSLAKKYHCTPAQLMIRWSLQNGFIPLPKSVSKERIEANGNIDFFEIDKTDMDQLSDLDEYLVTDWDPVDTD